MKENLVSLSAASKILNVSTETLRNWDRQGKLIAYRNPLNHYRMYDLEQLREIVKSNKNENIIDNNSKTGNNGNALKQSIKLMSKFFRDSEGGSMLDRFEEISKLLFCKLYDENYNESQTFNLLNEQVSDEDKYTLISELYQQAVSKFPTIFINSRSSLSNDKKAIVQVASLLGSYNLKEIKIDIKGQIYEELIKNTFDKNENQQFFTPRIIVDFIISIINPRIDNIICDPACGSGGFLISCLEHIQNANLQNYNNIIGVEIDSRMVWIAQMNILLHGGNFDSIKYLNGGGSLSYEKEAIDILPDNSVDLIITNPPFGSDFDNASDLKHFKLGEGKKSRRRSVLFVEKCAKLLKKNGQLAIILEESIFSSSTNIDVRDYILKNFQIDCIISLPESTFMPYASVKTSILIATKKKIKSQKILMCSLENIGYAPNGELIYTNERDENGKLKLLSDIPDVIEIYQEFQRLGRIQKQSEKYFVKEFDHNDVTKRLDLLYHHPSKDIAKRFLANSKFPIAKIGELVTIINKLTVPKVELPDEYIRYIGLANINAHDGSYFISEVLGEKIKSAVKLFEPDTVIYSKMRPELRKVIYIPENEETGFVSSECYVFKVGEKILPEFLSIVLRSDLVYGQIIFQVTGIGRPRIGKEELLSVQIPVPPIEKQYEIISITKTYENNRNSLLEKSKDFKKEADKLIYTGLEQVQISLCH